MMKFDSVRNVRWKIPHPFRRPQIISMYGGSSTYVKSAERARGVFGRTVGSELVLCGKSQVRTPASAFYLL